MKGQLAIGFICEFREHPSGNQVVGLPDYLAKVVNAGENPLREFLSQIQPGGRVNVMVVVEVLPR